MGLTKICDPGTWRVACCWVVLLLFVVPTAWAATALQVQIEGVKDETLENVRQLLSVEQHKNDADLTPARIRRLHGQAEKEIKQALEPFGYYQVQVNDQLQQTEKGWLARYVIKPGPQVRIGKLDLAIEGDAHDDPAFKKLLQDFPIRKGAPLLHQQYEKAKTALLTLAAERGYFDANLSKHNVEVDMQAYTARVELELASGSRYHFGPVKFEPTVVDEKLLRRFVSFQEGEPYLSQKLLELQSALIDSDYFERVEVSPQPGESSGLAVPVHVTLKARPRSRYSFGVGYGTDTGPRGSVGFDRRYVNRKGHRFKSQLQISQIRSQVGARYEVPVGDPRTDQVFFRTQYTDEDTKTSTSKSFELGTGLEQQLGLWRQVFSLTYLDSDFTVGTQQGHTSLLMPGASWTRLKTNDPLYTRNGSRVGLDLRGAYEGVLSDTSFVQARVHGKWIRSIGDDRIIARAEAGTTWVQDFDLLPPSVRFFAGGDQSVRGFAYQALGPKDSAGNVIGGRHLLVGSIEYEHRIKEKWAAAVFYDAGNAINHFGDELEHSVGVGVHWRSPVGWVRVDLAKPLSEPGAGIRLHLTIGPDL